MQVGVHCYIGLLSSMNAADTSLLAEEIIRKEDSVVPLLLSAAGDSKEDQARCILGLELLVHFIRAQSSSDVSALLADHAKQACAAARELGTCCSVSHTHVHARCLCVLLILELYARVTLYCSSRCSKLSTHTDVASL